MFTKAINDLTRGLSLYKVWTYQAWHDMSAKYKRTILGSLWIAGSMVTMSLVLSVVFGALLGQDLHTVMPNIMGGILCWGLAAFMLVEGPDIFMNAGVVIKSHAYPFSYYVFEAAARSFMIFLNNLVVFFIALALLGKLAIPHWTFVPGLAIVFVSMFTWGGVISLVSARFRDLRFMIPHLAQILYFLTPIMWRVEDISSENKARLADLNPFYGLIEVLRAPLLGHEPPQLCWVLALGIMGVGVILWLLVFGAFRKRIPFWV